MRILKLYEVAEKSLFKNKTRSFLTTLGIVIGVAAVIVMVAVGEGAQKNIEDNISSLGTNMLMIRSGSQSRGGVRGGAGSARTLTLKDETILREQATLLSGVSGLVNSNGQVIVGNANWSTQVQGVSMDYLHIRSWDIAEGNYFTERDLKAKSKVAVVGSTIVEQLFEGQEAVGQRIRIRNTPFKIVGVLKEKGQNSFGQDQDDIILVPLTTAAFRLRGDTQYVNMIYASSYSIDQMEAAEAEITEILRRAHKLIDGQEDDFSVRTQTEITEALSSTTQALTTLLGAIAGVSLFVGGVGIMNIMLVSVTERTREIGIRMAVGARQLDVLAQFLIEAVVLSLAGGISGVLLSWGFCEFLTRKFGMTTLIRTDIVLISLGVSAAIGVFFGLYPAKKAADLDPIDALRHE